MQIFPSANSGRIAKIVLRSNSIRITFESWEICSWDLHIVINQWFFSVFQLICHPTRLLQGINIIQGRSLRRNALGFPKSWGIPSSWMVEKRENRKQLNWMITRDSPHFRKPPNSTNSGRLRIEAVSASYPARSSLLWTWSDSVGSILCKNLRSSCATVFMWWFLSAMDSAAPQSAYIYTYTYIYIYIYVCMYVYIYINANSVLFFSEKKGLIAGSLVGGSELDLMAPELRSNQQTQNACEMQMWKRVCNTYIYS